MGEEAGMRIAFVWYWDRAGEIYPNWRDGLRAALEQIEKRHEVLWFLGKSVPSPNEHWDAILFWDDSNSAFFEKLDAYSCKKGLFLTTDPTNFENLQKLDVVFCESTPVYDAVRARGIRAIKAFGTDTDFFTPDKNVPKDVPYFYPATFSPWKRQSEIAYLGDELTCIGTVQPDGVGELEACRKAGVTVLEGYFPVTKIREYYRRAMNIIIPAVHGSERTVLEAMACNLLPEVTHPEINRRTASYIREYRGSSMKSPRAFVSRHYSHKAYARRIMKGIA